MTECAVSAPILLSLGYVGGWFRRWWLFFITFLSSEFGLKFFVFSGQYLVACGDERTFWRCSGCWWAIFPSACSHGRAERVVALPFAFALSFSYAFGSSFWEACALAWCVALSAAFNSSPKASKATSLASPRTVCGMGCYRPVARL